MNVVCWKAHMPRVPLYALIWSSAQGLYELSTQGQVVRRFHSGDEAAWLTWLEGVTSLAFHSPRGSLNVYQERRPRGGQYWYAYHTDRDGIRKRYLGRTAQVSLARLEETAQALSRAQARASDSPSFASPLSETEPGLLVTRLAPPHLPHTLVQRDHLLATLDGAFSSPLTLLSASAGWGKTTLLSSWASRHPHQIAWLALDALDNELPRFWTAVIAALRTRVPGVGALALAMLHAPEPPSVSAMVTALLNDLMQAQNQGAPFLLLLDDYQVIDDPAIQEAVTFWVEHLPARVHLLLASRVDPDLPLARWRARGHLLELRTADLCFGPEEASRFLRQGMGLPLSEEEVVALQRRTEGWVAALQLAALALRQQDDRAAWIARFTGSQRYVLDYVQQEILQRQPLPLQRFLLQVAGLTQMNASLCQAVTGEAASQELLETLERSNLFVVPLDDHRHWYRLHELFREALLVQVQAREPDLLFHVHQRAALWYEQQGDLRQAIEYALVAPDFSSAARLLEQAAPALWQSGEARSVLTWLAALPDAIWSSHARLVLDTALPLCETMLFTVQASYLHTHALVEQALLRLEALVGRQDSPTASREGEERAPAPPEAERDVVQRRLRLLRVLVAARTRVLRNDAEGLHQVVQELEGLDAGEEVRWKMVRLFLTFVRTETLQQEGTRLIEPLLEAKRAALEARDDRAASRVMLWLAFAYRRAEQLQHCEQECQEGLALARQTGLSGAGEGYLHYLLALVFYAWNRLEEAARSAHQALHIGQTWHHADLLLSGHLALAQIELARGDPTSADQALQQTETLVHQERLARYVFPVGALRARHWLATGKLEAARHWAEQVGSSPESKDPHQNSALLMQVRVWLEAQRYAQAVAALERYRAHLDRPADSETTSEFLALSVVALHQVGQREHAQAVLERLLALTGPEGNLRVYLDQGDLMKHILLMRRSPGLAPSGSTDQALSPWRAQVPALLAAFAHEEQRANALLRKEPTRLPSRVLVASSPAGSFVPDVPLTRREQEILRLLAEGASNQEIARALVIQLSTVKKHVSNLLSKLGAESRTQAIAQAHARSLL